MVDGIDTASELEQADVLRGATLGSNQLGLRQYNERIILQLIRRAGSLPKAEIARITNLSAQTVSVIINRLLADGLLVKEERRRGKVGQPSVPIALNAHGAFSIGVKIGRTSLDILTLDFTGTITSRRSINYDFPDPDRIFPAIREGLREARSSIPPELRGRLVGVGVAAPYGIGGWQQEIGAPEEVMRKWDEVDIKEKVQSLTSLPVLLSNDATAACIAELVFGKGLEFNSFLYLFIGTFIGGGVVLGGSLYSGHYGNAGAIGSLPIPAAAGTNGKTDQIISHASLFHLARRLRNAGHTVADLAGHNEPAHQAERVFAEWAGEASAAISFAVVSACSIIDFDGVILDGALPPARIASLVEEIDRRMDAMDLEGLIRPRLATGSIGADARAVGGAILPLYSNFAPDRELLLKLGS